MIHSFVKLQKLFNKRQKVFMFILFVMMLFGAILESLGVSLVFPLVSTMINGDNWNQTWYGKIICDVFNISTRNNYLSFLLIVLCIAFVFKNLYLYFEKSIQHSFIANNRLKMQKSLMKRYVDMPYEYFLSSSTGEIVRIITGDTNQVFELLTVELNLFTELFICFILTLTLIIINPVMSSFFIFVLVIEVIIITILIKPKMVDAGKRNRRNNSESNKWMLGAINGIKSVKISGTNDYFTKMYEKYAKLSIEAQKKNQNLSSVPKLFIEAFTITMVLMYVYVQIKRNIELGEIISLLSTFAVAAIKLLPSVSNISTNLNSLSYLKGSLDNILSIMEDTSGEFQSTHSASVSNDNFFKNSIELKDITYAYPNTKSPVIEDINLEIFKGQSIGVIGASGSGKTTTIDVLLGLLRPQKGQILVDGVSIYDDYDSWLSCLSYIPQQIFLMDDTIKANVAFGIDEHLISEELVWKSLEEAQLKDFVKSLPEQLNTKIGERGVRLSGGQCQRIGIARALYREPDILVFDEATSSLDNETEKEIMKSIDSLKHKKTMIIIAHRLTTIENCDVLYKVQDKKILKVR